MVSGIIMASGYSRRMGFDKLFFPFLNKKIIYYILKASSKSKLSSIICVGKDKKVKTECLKFKNIIFKYNKNAILGQSSSIKIGLKTAPSSLGYMFLPADQPFIDENIINFIIDVFLKNQNSIIVPIFNNNWSSPCIFPYDLKSELLNLQNDEKGKKLIHAYKKRVKTIEFSNSIAGFDLDTPDDLKLLKFFYKKGGFNFEK